MGYSSLGSIKVPFTEEDSVLSRLHAYVQMNGDLNEVDIFGETFLIRALKRKMYKAVLFLIEHGADLNVKDGNGVSALSYALVSGHSRVIDAFLSRSSELDFAQTDKCGAFLTLCCQVKGGGKDDDVSHLHYLLDKIDLDITKPLNGDYFIFFAIDTFSANLVRLYLDRGGSLFVRDSFGLSPLTYTEFKGREIDSNRGSLKFTRLKEIRELLMTHLLCV